MPRENSFTDSEGRSLTPDLEDEERMAGSLLDFPRATSPGRTPETISVIPAAVPAFASPSTRSLHRRPVHNNTYSTKTPKQRFRSAARRIIAVQRGIIGNNIRSGHAAGAEPGVNPRNPQSDFTYGRIKEDCVIEMMEYSSVRSSFGKMTNKEFIGVMNDDAASQREPWVKVRWINICGFSWDVIKAVALRYNLHPLALEDIFHARSQNRSKADYFSQHLFVRVLCHELGEEGEVIAPHHTPAFGSTLVETPRSASPEPFENVETEMDEEDGLKPRRRKPLLPNSTKDTWSDRTERGRTLLGSLLGVSDPTAALQKRQEQEITLDTLKAGQRVKVNVSAMFIFLMRDGTIISLRATPNSKLTQPITNRIRQQNTVLRTSADASLLLQALLDLVVDKALEVIDAYHTQINKFEKNILLKPKMKTVRSLHILSGDLTLRKRTLEPIKSLVYGLRRYDVDRCAALIDMNNPANANIKVVGFMSHKAKIYLADVADHMDYILSSLDMFASIAENLINYTFNIASYEMNEIMRRLTLVTIIFTPLTLLTGYFGMNFDPFPAVQKHSDVLFWYIAAPVMSVILPVFLWPDLQRLAHYVQKKMTTKKALEAYKIKQQ